MTRVKAWRSCSKMDKQPSIDWTQMWSTSAPHPEHARAPYRHVPPPQSVRIGERRGEGGGRGQGQAQRHAILSDSRSQEWGTPAWKLVGHWRHMLRGRTVHTAKGTEYHVVCVAWQAVLVALAQGKEGSLPRAALECKHCVDREAPRVEYGQCEARRCSVGTASALPLTCAWGKRQGQTTESGPLPPARSVRPAPPRA